MPLTEADLALRPVPFFDGYFVTSDGRVFSRKSGGLARKRHSLNHGYHHVSLWQSNRGKMIYVHRLVLLVFGPPPPTPKHEARHRDHDKSNNSIENLRWGTSAENKADIAAAGRWSRRSARPGWKPPRVPTPVEVPPVVEEDAAGLRWNGAEIRPIPSAIGYYAARDGRIVSALTTGKTPRIDLGRLHEIIPNYSPHGRLKIRGTNRLVHRLVLEAFRGPPPSRARSHGRHIDGNPAHNALDNLIWGTRSENMLDIARHGRANGIWSTIDAATAARIGVMLRDGYAVYEIVSVLRVSRSVVMHIRDGHSWYHAMGEVAC